MSDASKGLFLFHLDLKREEERVSGSFSNISHFVLFLLGLVNTSVILKRNLVKNLILNLALPFSIYWFIC